MTHDLVRCAACGSMTENPVHVWYQGHLSHVCTDCNTGSYFPCENCRLNFAWSLSRTGNKIGRNGAVRKVRLCERCFERYTECNTCGRRFPVENTITTSSGTHVCLICTMDGTASRLISSHDPMTFPRQEMTITGRVEQSRLSAEQRHEIVTCPSCGSSIERGKIVITENDDGPCYACTECIGRSRLITICHDCGWLLDNRVSSSVSSIHPGISSYTVCPFCLGHYGICIRCARYFPPGILRWNSLGEELCPECLLRESRSGRNDAADIKFKKNDDVDAIVNDPRSEV